ncbi:MAG TPA: hypothetical protein VFO85_01770 [Vicinamibacteria bacterium]|nr:hypothetical protein [Vicinamibacteria bacterium]
MSRRAAAFVGLLLALPACRGRARDPFVTYFNGEHLVSVRHPSTWRSEDGAQQGVWYRHFQGPPGESNTVTATLLAGPTAGALDQYAQSYLGANPVESMEEVSRQGAAGKRWRYKTADGSRRYALLLLQDAGHVWGLHTQAAAAAFDEHRGAIEEMEKSLTLERPRAYTEYRQERQGFAIRVPPTWTTGQNFATGGNYLMQFISPALAADKAQTLHASLTVTVEPLAAGGTLEGYYAAVRQRLGEAHKLLTELDWRGGRVAMFRVETPLAVSRAKRYFWASGPRGFSVTCEAREDVFQRVTRWCDVIAATLEIDGRPLPAEAPAAPTPAPTARPPLIAR